MKLTNKEKKILTLMDESVIDGFVEWVRRCVDLSEEEIKNTIKKFIDLEFVYVSNGEGGPSFYFHDKRKLKPEYLDLEFRERVVVNLERLIFKKSNFGPKK